MSAGFVFDEVGPGHLILMRGSFGMAELREWKDGWRVKGYGLREVGKFSTLDEAKSSAIAEAEREFAAAGLHTNPEPPPRQPNSAADME